LRQVPETSLSARHQPLSDQEKALCAALSEIFVDNDVDLASVAEIAIAFPVAEVEKAFFDWVAPVCGQNLLTPLPPVWTGFDESWLITEIEEVRQRPLGFWQPRWRRWCFASDWQALASLLHAGAD